MITVKSIKDKRTVYPDKDSQTFLSLPEYIKEAEILIKKTCNKSLIKQLINDDDTVSEVAKGMMDADWRWKDDQGWSREAYRQHMGRYAIIACINGQVNNDVVSLDHRCDENGEPLRNTVASGALNPEEICIEKEEENTNTAEAQRLLNNSNLTVRQKQCAEKFFLEEKSYLQIAEELDITRQAVQQNVAKAIKEMKSYAKVH